MNDIIKEVLSWFKKVYQDGGMAAVGSLTILLLTVLFALSRMPEVWSVLIKLLEAGP